MIVYTKHTTFGDCHVWENTSLIRAGQLFSYPLKAGEAVAVDYKIYGLQKQSWNRAFISGLNKITYVFWIVHLSCDPVLDKVGSPPAHRQQIITTD